MVLHAYKEGNYSRAVLPDDAGWNVDILHRNDPPQFLETVHIFDFTAEL